MNGKLSNYDRHELNVGHLQEVWIESWPDTRSMNWKLASFEKHELKVGQVREAWIESWPGTRSMNWQQIDVSLLPVACSWIFCAPGWFSFSLSAFWGNIAVAGKRKAGIWLILDHAYVALKYQNIEVQKYCTSWKLGWNKLIIDHACWMLMEQNFSFRSLSCFYRASF